MSSHYEVLGLQQDCSGKEIREAFVKLSKQLHPDKNPENPDCHKLFVRVNEAYTVLSKPDQRVQYDTVLVQRSQFTRGASSYASQNDTWVETNAPFGKTTEWRDDTIWSMRDHSQDRKYEHKPYYGIKGVNRVSNSSIAVGCVVFMLAGAVFHFFAVKSSSSKAIEQLDKLDKINADVYMAARNQALANGNKTQIERMRQRFGFNER